MAANGSFRWYTADTRHKHPGGHLRGSTRYRNKPQMVFFEAVGHCFLLCIQVNMTVQLFTELYTVAFVPVWS